MIIAIDGPVASGKSSLGKRLADELDHLFFDTGVMYRAVTFLALRELGSAEDRAAVMALAERIPIDVQPPTVADGRDCTILAQGEDITWLIRAKAVESNVSLVAAIPEVRRILTEQMRRVGLRGAVVMVGRDIGTVVLPEADHKIFLTASVEARARRRFLEAQARGDARSYADILHNLQERDRIDSSRQLAPLRAADDAIRLDTTELDLPGVLEALRNIVTPRPEAA
jgi:cytidylate kinase